VAAAKHRIEQGYEVGEVCKYFDFINVMSYDYHGSWDEVTGHNAPLYARHDESEKERYWNINASMWVWIESGCPRDKLNLGIAAYGRSFAMYSEKQSREIGKGKASAGEAGAYTMEPGVLSYYEICEKLSKDKAIKVFWHDEHDVPYAYKPGLWIGFDNHDSLVNKVSFGFLIK
jgi:chitinase